MSYKVKLDIFEGPFDLLVYLIENAEMNIYDIQVSEIIEQYLRYVQGMKALDVTLASEFMVLAAALIEIKSKMLIPRVGVSGENATSEDPRTELVARILEYKRFKQAAEFLEMQEAETQRIFVKPKEDLTPYTNEAEEYINLELNQFVKAFHMFLNKKKKLEEIKKNYVRIQGQRITMESKMTEIRQLFAKQGKTKLSFKELVQDVSSRYDVVLTFVCLLEMIKQKTLTVSQHANFGEITLKLKEKDEKVKENPLQEEGQAVAQ